jgi:hypothetical protein
MASAQVSILKDNNEQSMAGITGADWQNIDAKIDAKQATMREELRKELKPKGWREWKESILIFALLLFGGFVLHLYLPNAISAGTSDHTASIAKLQTEMDQAKQDIADLKKQMIDTLNHALDHAYQPGPTSSGTKSKFNERSAISRGTAALQIARSLQVKLDKTAVERFGREVASALKTDMAAREPLQAAAATIDYVSFQQKITNAFPNAEKIQSTPCQWFNAYQSDLTVSNTVLNGCGQQLDNNTKYENVTFRGSVIIYRGGQLHLKNVRFIDCLFVIDIPADQIPPVSAKTFLAAVVEKPPGEEVFIGNPATAG